MGTRAYRGRSPEERTTERRERLLAAGLDLWGELGWSGVTVRGVCARAGLTDRYFYESYADRDALLLAVFDQVRDGLAAVMLAVPWRGEPRQIMHAMLTALLTALRDDPRKATVAFTDPAGSPALESRRHDALIDLADTLAVQVAAATAQQTRVEALYCVGGVGALISTWLAGRLDSTAEALADRCTELIARSFAVP
ncbi:TetR/AcrR family transcriptional regulator [Actinocorallia longicatena]|uniref:TetR/AcrR family transcriptional regulator n=1 Tax=Actinocorallia longicatena TaxID=111803 RepID=A0ABP6QJ48_9ACTN